MDSPALSCPQCGFENPPRMRFCGNCGAALAAAEAAEERKLVTVLFADVVGSTKLSGALDPERLHSMMTRFFAIASEEIERYGGTVEKFIGDAVMAVFGLPTIHEDDPERAARAAAAIRDRVGPEVEARSLPPIRIALNTGEVVANPRAFERGEFLVTGEVVNLAARLQQHAEAGQILVGERTMDAIRRIARLEPVPPLTVKGAAAPVLASALMAVQPPSARELRGTPFVGREEELALLQGYLRRMLREGRGHDVTILGPAGVGKTRLAQEFRLRAADVRTLSGRAVPYGTGVPFWALGEAIRDECGVQFGDPLEEARRKVHERAATLDVPEAVPALLSVLGMAGDGIDLTRDALFAGMRTFFQSLAERSALLLILEDIHLAEDVTLDFLEHAADWVRSTPILLLGLARPELLERRTSWMGGKRSATTMALDPLGNEQSRELTDAILGQKPAPDRLIAMVMDRAEGNPLFMEEILRTLVDQGVLAERPPAWELTVPLADVTIPDTVHAVLAARVDALPAHEKRVLQNAALQGKDFWRGGLLIVADQDHVDESVRALAAKELIIPKRRSTVAGEEEFTFRHILIRDVAYGSIPKAQRWPKHARVAAWMEQIIGDRLTEFADFVAHHWLQVVQLRRELGLSPDPQAEGRAIDNLLIAGDRSVSVYANSTALDYYTQALEFDLDIERRLRTLLSRGDVWMFLGQHERAREDFSAARDLSRSTNQMRWEALALDHMGHAYRRQDLVDQALANLEPALALSQKIGDRSLAGRILNHIGFTYFSAGIYDRSVRAHEEARTLLEAEHDIAGLAESLHGLGDDLMFLGRLREGIETYYESIRLCERLGNRSLASESRFMVGFAQYKLGSYGLARMESARSITELTEIGDVRNLSSALTTGALLEIAFGNFGTALDYAMRALSIARQIGASRFQIYSLIALGKLYRELEDFHAALHVDREAHKLSHGVGQFWLPECLSELAIASAAIGRAQDAVEYLNDAHDALKATQAKMDFHEGVWHAVGRVAVMNGELDQARHAAAVLTEKIKSTGHLLWQIPTWLLAADVDLLSGRAHEAGASFAQAAAEAERQGLRPLQWRALTGLAEAERRIGHAEKAAEHARSAREIVDALAAGVQDERLRAAFLQSASVQEMATLLGS